MYIVSINKMHRCSSPSTYNLLCSLTKNLPFHTLHTQNNITRVHYYGNKRHNSFISLYSNNKVTRQHYTIEQSVYTTNTKFHISATTAYMTNYFVFSFCPTNSMIILYEFILYIKKDFISNIIFSQ